MKKYISKAPARICLFGDHQDYMQLPIIACGIDRYITIEAVANDQDFLLIDKQDLNESEKIQFSEPLEAIDKNDFLRIAMKVLKSYDCIVDKGYDIIISGNIPINAGLSSSSAFTVAWIQFLVEAFGMNQKLTTQVLAKLAYETEVLERNSSGGMMDQFTISYGGLIYLDTEAAKVHTLSANLGTMIVGVSGAPKDTFGTLADLKGNAWNAIHQVEKLYPDFKIKEANLEDIDTYKPWITNEFQAVFEAAIGNHMLTQKAKEQLEKADFDLKTIGDLMNEHHRYLRDYLMITIPLIDKMVDAALGAGALGAKIIGSGGGGCIVALCEDKNKEAIIQAIKNAGAIDAFEAKQSRGAAVQLIT